MTIFLVTLVTELCFSGKIIQNVLWSCMGLMGSVLEGVRKGFEGTIFCMEIVCPLILDRIVSTLNTFVRPLPVTMLTFEQN